MSKKLNRFLTSQVGFDPKLSLFICKDTGSLFFRKLKKASNIVEEEKMSLFRSAMSSLLGKDSGGGTAGDAHPLLGTILEISGRKMRVKTQIAQGLCIFLKLPPKFCENFEIETRLKQDFLIRLQTHFRRNRDYC